MLPANVVPVAFVNSICFRFPILLLVITVLVASFSMMHCGDGRRGRAGEGDGGDQLRVAQGLLGSGVIALRQAGRRPEHIRNRAECPPPLSVNKLKRLPTPPRYLR